MIPKIIHQSWTNWISHHGGGKGNSTYYPPIFRGFTELLKEYHPTWEHKMWNGEEERELIKEDYAWFLPIYDGYGSCHRPQFESGLVKRADASRFFYLHKYGGLYYDVDTECLKPHDNLLEQVVDFGVGQRGDDYNSPAAFPNSAMFARPGSLFIEKYIFKALENTKDVACVVDATGPTMLSHVARKGSEYVKVFPWEHFYAVDWEKENGRNHNSKERVAATNEGIAPDHEETKKRFPSSYSVTYCTSSWIEPKAWLRE